MSREILLLSAAELRRAVPLDRGAVDVVEGAFRALAEGRVVMPPVLSMEIAAANGEVDVKTAYIEGLDVFAVKISPGFFDNPKIGLPSLSGLMVALSATTGQVRAVLLDEGYLTDLRTAAAGAVAARHLAPARVETAGVIGAGAQARLQMIAAHLERPYGRGLVWARDPARAGAAAAEIAAATGADVRAEADPARLVAESQLVVTATPARAPVLRADWLHPGLHVTAMGSDQAGKNEIEPAALAAADAYVCDRRAQAEVMGELRAALAAGLGDRIAPVDLGEVIAGRAPARRSEEAVTLCDLTGTGAQDTAIAAHALAAAAGLGAGTGFAAAP
ncbi:MAG: cyclodeaminase [Paracoccaceae bacterium]